ncbi:MAG: HutD family protein [Kangiellaceae bacterium]|nr:HutD family protein [Kangiellaceae bacterium]
MISIIAPHEFKHLAWKNGKGVTSELAISDGGDLNNFDWRLSIAGVSEDGGFSSFPAIQRYLFLLTGQGMKLEHAALDSNEVSVNYLNKPLDLAVFDGGAQTYASLANGPIRDFNLMVKSGVIEANVECLTEMSVKELQLADINFVYPLSDDCRVMLESQALDVELQAEHLMRIDSPQAMASETKRVARVKVQATQAIVIALKKVCTNLASE